MEDSIIDKLKPYSDLKHLEAKVLAYRQILAKHCIDLQYLGYTNTANQIMLDYDNHFNIQTVKEGKVGND